LEKFTYFPSIAKYFYSLNHTGVILMVTTTDGLFAIAASIAMAGGLIGTGMAQSGIGASGMGVIAEKPEKFGQVLFFFVIPETLWIIGFVLGLILLLHIL
jgi:V/A-type H+-transporting ATPase subunit K